MATGREGRAERLNERLRGAQRANIEGDDTFNLQIPGLDLPAEAAPSTSETASAAAAARQTPNTSAKRKRVGNDGRSATARRGRPPSSQRSARSAAQPDEFDLPDSSKESAGPANTRGGASTRARRAGARAARPSTRPASSVRTRSSSVIQEEDEDDVDALEALPPSATIKSPVRVRRSIGMVDEVAESPARAPGSGRRQSSRASAPLSSSSRLREVTNADTDSAKSSSPLARKQVRGGKRGTARGGRAGARAVSRSRNDENERGSVPELTDEEANRISDGEAARTLGRKRPRRSMHEKSPELGSGQQEDENEDQSEDEPVPKRARGGRSPKSPAKQKQPATRRKSQPAKQPKRKAPAKTRRNPRGKQQQNGEENDEGGTNDATLPIDITVQRFVNLKDDGADPLQAAAIPYINHTGESVVDVFAQVCEEVIGYTLAQYEELAASTDDPARKKECRVKVRALEAYREELSSRSLQHAIHLNHWRTLRKRVRHVQKEKLALREEILRLKAEREQVALRMDAVRAKHEAESKDATARLEISSLMDDIDLAVGRGQQAPEIVSKAELRRAELANLELVVAQVADQASPASTGGGLLGQLKEFNAFLQRTATALETK